MRVIKRLIQQPQAINPVKSGIVERAPDARGVVGVVRGVVGGQERGVVVRIVEGVVGVVGVEGRERGVVGVGDKRMFIDYN